MGTDRTTVLITGAAGHLGAAVAAWFERQGARLVLLDREDAVLLLSMAMWLFLPGPKGIR